MRVLHLTGWPIPESLGGTEVYLVSVAQALGGLGVQSVIGCRSVSGPRPDRTFDGVEIAYFDSACGPAAIEALVARIQPSVINVHAITEGLGPAELAFVGRCGVPIILTIHMADAFCPRGTMMEMGVAPCDGELIPTRCASCYLNRQGLAKPLAKALVQVPAAIRRVVPVRGRARTALGLVEQMADNFAAFKTLCGSSRRIIAVCDWLAKALERNGIDRQKIVVCRHGSDSASEEQTPDNSASTSELVIGFLGRLDRGKGIDVLVRAFRQLPREWRMRLLIHGRPSGSPWSIERGDLNQLAAGDGRISIGNELARHEVDGFMKSLGCLAVPSIWLETGPLVVYEAYKNGVPVIGTDRGGVSELVKEGQTGILVPNGGVRDWVAALSRAHMLWQAGALPRPIPSQVRTWRDVATELRDVYRAVGAERPVADLSLVN